MSFTSTLSVHSRTVLVSGVELFFFKPTSMENILQSIVKIIIIGCLYECKNADGSRHFLPPPLPYYQNDDYFAPGFALPYQEPLPIYYQDGHAPPPISFQNVNSYTQPQLFHQNENYNPLQAANPGGIYTPPILPYKPSFYPSYKPQQRINIGVNYKSHSQVQGEFHNRPGEVSPKKPAFYATNIIVKEEGQPPYYHDDYSKSYNEEDYNDNYSDDISSPTEPCLNSPYRYFERAKTAPNKYNLCNPHFQPPFGNGVYTVKTPITLLPSRFPPRVEELIERIQNYFSTYTQQEKPKPQNQTSVATTLRPVTEATSESATQSTGVMGTHKRKNTTVEIEELSLELANGELPATTAAEAVIDPEGTTQKTIVVEIGKDETKEGAAASAPDVQATIESQVAIQSTQSPSTTEFFANRQQNSHVNSMIDALHPSSPTENQIGKDWSQATGTQTGSPVTHAMSLEGMGTVTESQETTKSSEETNTIQPIVQVTDSKG